MAEENSTGRPLGQAGHSVRVLNFAGGSFDTIMQLGTAHALLVIQGRAPDAIVGISAGAVQAAAVAEILQAGEGIEVNPAQDEALLRERYRRRQEQRVKTLRKFINAAQRAPETLFDASLPDAYQIESTDPLQPLRTARFAKDERDERERMLRVRSGLVRLYNHLLGIHLPVGTVTRIVRRWLGFQAAAEIPGWWSSLSVRALELFRIWLLAGAELHRLVTVAPMLVRPFFFSRARAGVATAGSLIFRFRALHALRSALIYVATLFVLSTTWVTLSALPAYLVYLFAKEDAPWYLQAVLGLPYLFPLAMALLQVVNKHDAVTRRDALRDGFKGFIQFVISLFLWGSIAFLLWAVIAYSAIKELWKLHSATELLSIAIAYPDIPKVAVLFSAGTAVSAVIGIRALILFWRDRARRIRAAQPAMSFMRWYGKRFLQSYNLSRSLLHHHGLEKFLAEVFDPDYYGALDTGKTLEKALRSEVLKPAGDRDPTKCFKVSDKKIANYYAPTRRPPIAVGLGVADIATGKVEVMDDEAPLVCGLRAATALVPLLPAVNYGGRLYTDCTNVTAVPMPALLRLLRRHGIHERAGAIHVYRVAPVPFSQPQLPRTDPSNPFLNLVDIAFRAMKLRQYRDADLERRLTHHYTQVIPATPVDDEPRGAVKVKLDGAREEKQFFRIWVAPVELELPLDLNQRIVFADRTRRRVEILRTIAQGCRAALQVMIPDALAECAKYQPDKCAPCGRVVRTHLGQRQAVAARTVAFQPLPGSAVDAAARESACDGYAPPGLSEICEHCQLDSEGRDAHQPGSMQVLVWQGWEQAAPSWPHEFDAPEDATGDRHFDVTPTRVAQPQVIEALGRYWPLRHDPQPGKPASPGTAAPVDRPTVSLLFSGGVFRGVFQIGVVNALNELRVKPDIVAGASVGSITAGIAAQILGVLRDDEQQRGMQLARLAGAYLAVDRIILTDRFADFVREFTIRAATTRFSLRQADRLFRKYDQPWTMSFDHGARQVVAGIERLFYVNFYQLNRLVRALRNRHDKRAAAFAKHLAQQWLDRMNVGEEVLGAEPLKALITHFITDASDGDFLRKDRHDPIRLEGTFQRFVAHGVVLLATSTDLSDGRLVTLGDPFRTHEESSPLDLAEALLASSAFPGVFRPRWSPELFPYAHRNHQFIDGGVMDNLPIDAVAQLLLDTSSHDSTQRLIVRRPRGRVPHLVFAASLEPEVEAIKSSVLLSALQGYWPALSRRVKQLRYNRKLDNYRSAATEISGLYERFADKLPAHGAEAALNLEIAALKPKWLCGTFAFHPMLGYRRARQAQSIAHGCALTLLKFKEYKDDWLTAWGINPELLPVTSELSAAQEAWRARQSHAKPGECWLRAGTPCPFSKVALHERNMGTQGCASHLDDHTIAQISRIHTCCSDPRTHQIH